MSQDERDKTRLDDGEGPAGVGGRADQGNARPGRGGARGALSPSVVAPFGPLPDPMRMVLRFLAVQHFFLTRLGMNRKERVWPI